MAQTLDIYHFRPKELLSFWGISRDKMLKAEGKSIKEMPRDHAGNRYLSLFEAAQAYNGLWCQYPTRSQVAEWLIGLGFSKSDIEYAVLRLEAKGLVRTGLS